MMRKELNAQLRHVWGALLEAEDENARFTYESLSSLTHWPRLWHINIATILKPIDTTGRAEQETRETKSFSRCTWTIFGDINAQHRKWYRITNSRGSTVLYFTQRYNTKIAASLVPSFHRKGEKRNSNTEILMSNSSDLAANIPQEHECRPDHAAMIFKSRAFCHEHMQENRITLTLLSKQGKMKVNRFYKTALTQRADKFDSMPTGHFHQGYSELRKAIRTAWEQKVCERPKKHHCTGMDPDAPGGIYERHDELPDLDRNYTIEAFWVQESLCIESRIRD